MTTLREAATAFFSNFTELIIQEMKKQKESNDRDFLYKDILTLEEAAVYLNVEQEEILREVQQGNLPGMEFEKSGWRFRKWELANALDQRRENTRKSLNGSSVIDALSLKD
jgi:excisionase family DNA binding protein